MLRTVYFTFTKKSVVLWKGTVPWRYSNSYTIDSHPYTLGQIQLAAASASNILLPDMCDWMEATVLLDDHSCIWHPFHPSRQSVTHSCTPQMDTECLLCHEICFAESIAMNQEEKANTNYKWHILVRKTFIDISKLCTLIQMLIHSDWTNKDKCRESLSDVSNHVSMQSLRNWIEIYSYLSGILNYVHFLSFFSLFIL